MIDTSLSHYRITSGPAPAAWARCSTHEDGAAVHFLAIGAVPGENLAERLKLILWR